MRRTPFSLQGKGAVEVAAATGTLWKSTATSSGGGKRGGVEPRPVLDHRRSPSPPTSTSTLCSSQGGGGGSTDSAGVAAVSDNPLHKCPPSQDTPSSGPAEADVGGGGGNGEGRREDWAAELQPIPAGLEIGLLGGDKCGLGMEDWESVMLAEPGGGAGGGGGGASPGHDQSFLKWIMGEVEDPTSAGGLRQQGHHQMAMEFEGGAGALGGPPGLVDPVFGFEHLGGMGIGLSGSLVAPPLPSSSSSSSPVASLGGFTVLNSNNGGTNIDSRLLPISPGSGHLQALKGPIFGHNSNPNPLFSPPAGNTLQLPLPMPPGMLFQEPAVEEKPHLFGPNLFLSQQQANPPPPNPAFFLPYAQPDHQQQQQQHHPLLPPRPKRLHSMADHSCQVPPGSPFSDPAKDPFLRRLQQQEHPQAVEGLHHLPFHNLPQVPMKPKVAGDEAAAAAAAQQQQQVLVDQLLKAAEMVEARNFVNARGILARLNHQLSPSGKPLVRSAYYCKEALQCITTDSSNGVLPSTTSPPPLRNPFSAAVSTPFDVVLKLSAYKAFSEVSPIVQFANFTCIQALLEELNGCAHIHIIDFDIGVGGQWSSFMQELAQRRCSATTATPVLKITAFASLYSSHPLELGLTRENLSQFASDLNIPFEINILSIDNFEPANLLNLVQSDEAIAVNLPMGLAYPSITALLRLLKQLAPKIVVSVDHGCDRGEVNFSRYFLHSLQSATFLLDSIDAAGTSQDVANKIERYLLQPRIENAFLVRHRAADNALPLRTLFNSSGFVSVPFSNFTETQAECLLKRFQVRGFHVEKRQQSLLLCWQQGELVSVSAWRC